MRQEILEILENDCRVTPEQIAVMLGEDAAVVKETIGQLENEKVVLKYQAVINHEKIDNGLVTALIDVKVAPQREVGFDQVAARIYRYPEVRSVFLVSGAYDLAVMVQGHSLQEVAAFVSEKLAALEHVQSTMTHFLLKTYKQDGVIFADQEEDRRQVVTP